MVGPAQQIGRFGSPDQHTAAAAVIKETTAKLYRILADGPQEQPNDGPASGSGDGAG